MVGPPPLAHAEGRRSSPMCRFPDDYANRAAVALRWPATGVPFDRTARRPRHEDQLRATQPPGGDGSPGCHSAPVLCRHVSAGRLQKPMSMSWVTLDRICAEEMLSDEKIRRLVEGGNRPLRSRAEQLSDEELLDKLRGFGLDLDRPSLERLCESALSAEEVAGPLIDGCGFRDDSERMQGDWIWICLVCLWERWWPDKVCLELLDDKVQAGYSDLEHDAGACAATWLGAWSDALRLCDATGIRSIEGFDARFPMTQSLYNWSQDLEDALWNAGLGDREMLLARIAVCEEALRRFPGEDQLMTENRRRALAESYFEVGKTEKAEELFRSWLAADPCWGFGWIGWAPCYNSRARRPPKYRRAGELLRPGYSTTRLREREGPAAGPQSLLEEKRRPCRGPGVGREDKERRAPAGAGRSSRSAAAQPGRRAVATERRSSPLRARGRSTLSGPRATVSWSPSAPARRSSTGIVGVVPPASKRATPGWVMRLSRSRWVVRHDDTYSA